MNNQTALATSWSVWNQRATFSRTGVKFLLVWWTKAGAAAGRVPGAALSWQLGALGKSSHGPARRGEVKSEVAGLPGVDCQSHSIPLGELSVEFSCRDCQPLVPGSFHRHYSVFCIDAALKSRLSLSLSQAILLIGLKANCLQCSVADAHGKAAINHFGLNKMLINVQSVCHHTWLSLMVLQNYRRWEAWDFNEQKNDSNRAVHKKPFQIPQNEGSHHSAVSKVCKGYGRALLSGERWVNSTREEILSFYLYMFYLWRYIFLVASC